MTAEQSNERPAYLNWRVTTSEMINEGVKPDVVLAGACATVSLNGTIRNPGRDLLGERLTEKGYSFFEVQIDKSTHGRGYNYEIDGPNEKKARREAKVRVYEIRPDTISTVSHLEIMDDNLNRRKSIVWFHGAKTFTPEGLGDRKAIKADAELRAKVGDVVADHLYAYANAGHQLRSELQAFLANSPYIIFVDGDETAVMDEIEKALDEAKRYTRSNNVEGLYYDYYDQK